MWPVRHKAHPDQLVVNQAARSIARVSHALIRHPPLKGFSLFPVKPGQQGECRLAFHGSDYLTKEGGSEGIAPPPEPDQPCNQPHDWPTTGRLYRPGHSTPSRQLGNRKGLRMARLEA
jgi:hypothetical protein